MKNKTFFKKLGVSALSVLTAASMLPIASLNAFGAELKWEEVDGKKYWYEDGVKMGVYGGAGNVWYDGTERGKEIYDPASDGWYWLDALYDGAKAEGKEVFMPYIYGNEGEMDSETKANLAYESNTAEENIEHAKLGYQIKMAMLNGTGKWVRYDENGKMLKGWVKIEGALADKYPDQVGNVYYYDRRTGVMAKGIVEIDGKHYEFDRTFGTLVGETTEPTDEEVAASKTTYTNSTWSTVLRETTLPDGTVTDRDSYEIDSKGREIKYVDKDTSSTTDSEGNVTYSDLYTYSETTYEYDDSDPSYSYRYSKQTTKRYNSNAEDNYHRYTTVTDYVNGKRSKETTTYVKEDEQKSNHITTYEYKEINGSKYTAKTVTEYPNNPDRNSSTEYSYDDKGNRTETRTYNAEGAIVSKEVYEYNDQGYETRETYYTYDGANEIPSSKYEYSYGEKNRQTEYKYYDYREGEWKLESRTEYKYNDKGYQIESDSYDIESDGTERLSSKNISKYKTFEDYDRQVGYEYWYSHYVYNKETQESGYELGFNYGYDYDYEGPYKDKDGADVPNVSYRQFSYNGYNNDYKKPDKADYITDYFKYNYPENPTNGQQFSTEYSKRYDGSLNLISTTKYVYQYSEYTYEE